MLSKLVNLFNICLHKWGVAEKVGHTKHIKMGVFIGVPEAETIYYTDTYKQVCSKCNTVKTYRVKS